MATLRENGDVIKLSESCHSVHSVSCSGRGSRYAVSGITHI